MASQWPTATTTDSKSSARHGYMIEGNAGTTLLDAVRGWPTPMTVNSTSEKAKYAEEPETFLARKEVHATKENATRAGVPLAVAVKWASPQAERAGRRSDMTPLLPDQASNWATPASRDGKGAFDEHTKGGRDLSADAALWPTTTAQDAKNNGGASQAERNTPPLNVVVAGRDWSTPTVPTGGSVSRGHDRVGELLLTGQAQGWATPRATEGEKGGTNGRDGTGSAHLASQAARPGLVLNPVFVEALMGWPLGWTDPLRPVGPRVPFPPPPTGAWPEYLAAHPGTEPALPKAVERDGAPRTDRLRACGNGVVPAQAAAALSELFAALDIGRAAAHARFLARSRSGPPPHGILAAGPLEPRGWRNRWRNGASRG